MKESSNNYWGMFFSKMITIYNYDSGAREKPNPDFGRQGPTLGTYPNGAQRPTQGTAWGANMADSKREPSRPCCYAGLWAGGNDHAPASETARPGARKSENMCQYNIYISP